MLTKLFAMCNVGKLILYMYLNICKCDVATNFMLNAIKDIVGFAQFNFK